MKTIFERDKENPKEKFIYIGVITLWVYLFFYSTIKILFEIIPLEDVDSTKYLLYFFSLIICVIVSVIIGGLLTIICGYSFTYIIERIFVGKIDIRYEYREKDPLLFNFLSNKYSRTSISLSILLFITFVDSIKTIIKMVINESYKYLSNFGIIIFQENTDFLIFEYIFYIILIVLTLFLLITLFYKRIIFRIEEHHETKRTEITELDDTRFFAIKSFIFSLFLCIGVTFYFYFNGLQNPLDSFRIIVYSIISSFFILFFPTLFIFRFSIDKIYTRNIGFTETWLLSIISLFIFYNLLKFLIPLFELISDFIFQILKEDFYSYQPTSVVILFYITLTIIYISFLRFIFKRGLKEPVITET
jgi:hypothetical protein